MNKKEIDEESLIKDYENLLGIVELCSKYHIGKLRVKEMLLKHNITIRDTHFSKLQTKFIVSDWKIKKYIEDDTYTFIAVSKDGKLETKDYENKAGILTNYIHEKYSIEIPTLYDRRKYYQETGNYWFEQWFDIIKIERKKIKKCPYCDWNTIDLDNKSGMFMTHLKNAHNKTIEDYLNEYPEDSTYFKKYSRIKKHNEKLNEENNYILCPICGKKLERMTPTHLETVHNISMDQFKANFPNVKIMSNNNYQQAVSTQKLSNLVVSKDRFISSYENEIRHFLDENNIKYEANRQILIGKEMDILVPDKKIGIEFDGLKWHTEWFGKKSHKYHLEKTLMCNEKGYKLIHIFEDEYVNNKEIVYSKLKQILGLNKNKPKIAGRKCTIKEIYKNEAEIFLNKYHIQGYCRSSIYLGAFFNEELIGVMCFKNGSIKNKCWDLTRFASSDKYICQGIGGKLFNYFIENYNPYKIISFADRRWTMNKDSNLYTKLGFILEKENAPDYRYYNERVDKFKRIHKMFLTKEIMIKKYGFPSTMTETEMAKELGYDRIWDCGLFKYVWYKK